MDGVADRARRIVEIDVDPVGAGDAERIGEAGRAIIDGGVVTKGLAALRDLVRAAGDPDGAAAENLGDLPDRRADGARGGRDHDRLAGPRLADDGQADERRHAVDTQNP